MEVTLIVTLNCVIPTCSRTERRRTTLRPLALSGNLAAPSLAPATDVLLFTSMQLHTRAGLCLVRFQH